MEVPGSFNGRCLHESSGIYMELLIVEASMEVVEAASMEVVEAASTTSSMFFLYGTFKETNGSLFFTLVEEDSTEVVVEASIYFHDKNK